MLLARVTTLLLLLLAGLVLGGRSLGTLFRGPVLAVIGMTSPVEAPMEHLVLVDVARNVRVFQPLAPISHFAKVHGQWHPSGQSVITRSIAYVGSVWQRDTAMLDVASGRYEPAPDLDWPERGLFSWAPDRQASASWSTMYVNSDPHDIQMLWLHTPRTLPRLLVDHEPVMVSLVGMEERLSWQETTFTPDGTHIVFTGRTPRGSDIIAVEVATGTTTNLTMLHNSDPTRLVWRHRPRVSPDGTRLVFVVEVIGDKRLYAMGWDGTGARALYEGWGSEAAWSPDGARLALAVRDEYGQRHLVVVDAHDPDAPRTVLHTGSTTNIHWSPDGAWIAFEDTFVFVIPADGSAPARRAVDVTHTNTLVGWQPRP